VILSFLKEHSDSVSHPVIKRLFDVALNAIKLQTC
jgi:hypothetical protein